jgi:hypothetical protein
MAGGSQEADAEDGVEGDDDTEPPVPAFGAVLPPTAGEAATDASGGFAPAAGPLIALVGVVSAAAVVFFGIIPSPLFDFAWHAGRAITGIF